MVFVYWSIAGLLRALNSLILRLLAAFLAGPELQLEPIQAQPQKLISEAIY